jgi:hypothetical protein
MEYVLNDQCLCVVEWVFKGVEEKVIVDVVASVGEDGDGAVGIRKVVGDECKIFITKPRKMICTEDKGCKIIINDK